LFHLDGWRCCRCFAVDCGFLGQWGFLYDFDGCGIEKFGAFFADRYDAALFECALLEVYGADFDS
jgi:hypothetical protein